MRNVRLHLEADLILDVKTLSGEMVSNRPGQPPVFDDPTSYALHVDSADVSMDMASLSVLMNRHVWNYDNAPLSDVKVQADGALLAQQATLHKGVAIPISMKASVSATTDGRMRLHTEQIHALGIPATKLLDVFGLSVEGLVHIKADRGIEIDHDDIVIDPANLLPPPRMSGKLTDVRVSGAMLHQVIGQPPSAPPNRSTPRNFIHFTGSTLRFGKITMSDADLMLIDADPRDPFDFFGRVHRAVDTGLFEEHA